MPVALPFVSSNDRRKVFWRMNLVGWLVSFVMWMKHSIEWATNAEQDSSMKLKPTDSENSAFGSATAPEEAPPDGGSPRGDVGSVIAESALRGLGTVKASSVA